MSLFVKVIAFLGVIGCVMGLIVVSSLRLQLDDCKSSCRQEVFEGQKEMARACVRTWDEMQEKALETEDINFVGNIFYISNIEDPDVNNYCWMEASEKIDKNQFAGIEKNAEKKCQDMNLGFAEVSVDFYWVGCWDGNAGYPSVENKVVCFRTKHFEKINYLGEDIGVDYNSRETYPIYPADNFDKIVNNWWGYDFE